MLGSKISIPRWENVFPRACIQRRPYCDFTQEVKRMSRIKRRKDSFFARSNVSANAIARIEKSGSGKRSCLPRRVPIGLWVAPMQKRYSREVKVVIQYTCTPIDVLDLFTLHKTVAGEIAWHARVKWVIGK